MIYHRSDVLGDYGAPFPSTGPLGGRVAGFTFDAFDLRRMRNKFREGTDVHLPNGDVMLEVEYDGSHLPSTGGSRRLFRLESRMELITR